MFATKSCIALLALCALATVSHGSEDVNYMHAELSGEGYTTPQTGSDVGSGYAIFTLNTTAKTLNYTISYTLKSGEETSAHIHGFSAMGDSSGVLHTLPDKQLGAKRGVWDYGTDKDIVNKTDFETKVKAGMAYVNVHTEKYPEGEIRGQMMVRPAIEASYEMMANLTAQAVPGNASTSKGSGIAKLTIDTDSRVVKYTINYTLAAGNKETAAHLHGFSSVGVNSGVLIDISSSAKSGSFMYTEDQAIAIIMGKTYLQIHSDKFPGGEIRGQVVENPASMKSAAGRFIAFPFFSSAAVVICLAVLSLM